MDAKARACLRRVRVRTLARTLGSLGSIIIVLAPRKQTRSESAPNEVRTAVLVDSHTMPSSSCVIDARSGGYAAKKVAIIDARMATAAI